MICRLGSNQEMDWVTLLMVNCTRHYFRMVAFWTVETTSVSHWILMVSRCSKAAISQFGWYINELIQERRNSIANALELRLSCINPMICSGEWAAISKRMSRDYCILAGLWFGETEPAICRFMKLFVESFSTLEKGITINSPDRAEFACKAILLCGTLDLPAHSLIC